MQANRIKWLVAVAQIGVLAAVGSAFAAAGKVYVADEESNTVSVIDAVPVGKGPNGISMAP